MKESQIKYLKKCFGSKKEFYKKRECITCPFKRKCFLKINNLNINEKPYEVSFKDSKKDLNTYDNKEQHGKE